MGGACVRYAGTVEISSSSLGSWLCCDLSLMVFGSNLLAQLTGNKGSPSPSPKVWMDSGFSWEQFKKKIKPSRAQQGPEHSSGGLQTPSCLQTQTNSRAFQFHSPVSFHISHLSDLCRVLRLDPSGSCFILVYLVKTKKTQNMLVNEIKMQLFPITLPLKASM